MKLSVDFHFTASNLQDYLTCERRFELKAIQQCQWPALPSQPVQEQEEHMRNGILFHQYVNQCFLGIPSQNISDLIQNTSMLQWWNNFLQTFDDQIRKEFIAFEHTLAGYLDEFSILSKIDALRVKDQQWIIYDWKTGLHLPKAQTMQNKIQSRLYPYMLATFGAGLNNNTPLQADQISMMYWFPEFPNQEIQFSYSKSKYDEDQLFLKELMAEIVAKKPGEFYLTEQDKNCIYCVYRSLCARGSTAGDYNDIQEEDAEQLLDNFLQELDIDQIEEIAF
ncbi:MAG: PD-(D/E)XK nuclease family protein [Anaerolineaceae bacterium]|nr:PD-(D/E)XK nuclease family protein [Anaerolineaceae bacterium]